MGTYGSILECDFWSKNEHRTAAAASFALNLALALPLPPPPFLSIFFPIPVPRTTPGARLALPISAGVCRCVCVEG
jgi:hypothetical protein